MKYVNADRVLPKTLIQEIQKYIQGGLLYVPTPKSQHKKWGEQSGGRKMLNRRNTAIRHSFAAGSTVDELAEQYCLSSDSIKKNVYTKS
ncbi:CD3324 family protein [Paenibacillus alvei]|uniref:CD3324 family protein n=1 Tax=Paenibacillus alvei TaxID=44250 RepID=A0ABT4E869_PAEAL|nr:CD3324 family protein [Paenibacillus alvei]MCY9529924.1 CD3324 family protein [Paenibacillus alvei]